MAGISDWWRGLVAGTVGGSVAALGVVWGLGGQDLSARGEPVQDIPEKRQAAAVDEGGPRPISEDEQARIASLERRVSLLTRALARGETQVEAGEAGETDTLQDVDVADPVFEAAVLDIMDRERDREEGEREERRSELRAERSRRFASRLTEQLALTNDQQAGLTQLVDNHFERFRELRDRDNPDRPVTRREWRERVSALQEQAERELAELLTGPQLEQYRALDPDDQLVFGWGRRSERRPQQAGQNDADRSAASSRTE